MLRPERMHQITILVKNEDKHDAIELLAEAKAIHVIDHKKEVVSDTEVGIGEPEATAEELSEALTKTRSLLSKLPTINGEGAKPRTLPQRIARVNELAEKFSEHEQALSEAKHEVETIEEQERLLELIEPLGSPVEALFKSNVVSNYLVRYEGDGVSVREFKPVFVMGNRKKNVMLLTVMKDENIEEKLKAANLTTIDLQPLGELTGTVAEVQHHLKERRAVVEHKKKQEELGVENIATHVPFLKESEEILAIALMKAQAPLHFGTTKYATVIRGFVPEYSIDELEKKLEKLQAVVSIAPAEKPPSKLHNPLVLDNFEALIKLYTLPKYNEIDPTSIMAITFPVFFGFMLGDIGYGIIFLGAFFALKHYIPKTKQFADILILSAISTIAFGIFFGEFMGTEQIFGYHLHPFIHRAHDLSSMFLIAIIYGMVHINLGLIFGIINEWHKGVVHALAEKGSWVLLQLGAILLGAAYGFFEGMPLFGNIHANAILGWILLIVSVVGIGYAEGVKGIIELPMIFSHTLSYTRLVAIGLASVSLALVVNGLGGDLIAKGGLWIVFGVFVLIVGHIVNLALGLIGPFLHSLRLHYVEFFMKFYQGGGEPYKPFGIVHKN